MSSVDIYGTLILNGNLTCDGTTTIHPSGLVAPVPDSSYMDAFFSCPSSSYITPNGIGRTIESTEADIVVQGIIDGDSTGFQEDKGPGCNSVLLDNFGLPIRGYGATHAGVGSMTADPGVEQVFTEEITLTETNIIEKKVQLSALPLDPTDVAVNIIGGGPQYYPDDYEVIDDFFLSWLGKNLDGQLAEGDKIRAVYEGRTVQIIPDPKDPYGSYEKPTSLGSGSFAAKGGGSIKLEARAGTVSLNGIVTMDGQDGASGIESGGGSGGSLWVSAWNIDGTGSLTATGGGYDTTAYAGGGGGGYIALRYEHNYDFGGAFSVDGSDGGQKGIFYAHPIDPFFKEKFTGQIWNTKWWETIAEPVTLNNWVRFDSSQGLDQTPTIQSLFSISGRNITVDADYIPVTTFEPNLSSAHFLLYSDEQNWIGVARKKNHYCGVYSVGGITGQTAVAADNSAVTFRILKTDATFTFQYYDCTNPPYTIGSAVIPELDTLRYRIRMGVEKSLSGSVTEYFYLGNSDLSNQQVALSGVPLDASAVAMNLIGGGPQFYGTDFYVSGQYLKWDGTAAEPFRNNLEVGDAFRVIYETDVTSNEMSAGFDYFRVFNGILFNTETSEPIVYVDPINGSDSSNGQQLSPLENLFVATAWARRGGIVVLYDGTYNPTEITGKNLTIRGANGSNAVVTSRNVQDTTGSGWENNAISFAHCQGRVHNLTLYDSTVGVLASDTQNLDVFQCYGVDVTTGVLVNGISWSPSVRNCEFSDASIAVDFSSTYDPYVESCVIYDSVLGVRGRDSTNLVVTSSTLDGNITAVQFDQSSSGVIASSNVTNNNNGVDISPDSSAVYSYNNNFYGTGFDYPDTNPDGTGNNIDSDPLYVDESNGDYRISSGSPNISAGTEDYDQHLLSFDLMNRSLVDDADIGAFEYLDGTHDATNWYVAGQGDDYVNFGNRIDPFRTLDKAMSVADALIEVDGGHYDSYYLDLASQNIYLNKFTVLNSEEDVAVTYATLSSDDIDNGWVTVPGYYPAIDGTSIAVNAVGGPSQYFGTDFTVAPTTVIWSGLAMDGILSAGDVLRVVHPYRIRPADTLTLHSHFSNIDISRMVFVSPNGSDTTTVTGDGTEGWGNGTYDHPFRTVDKALSDSTAGDYVIALPGAYELFTGVSGRVLVPISDTTSLDQGKRILRDDFNPLNFTSWNHIEYDSTEWDLNYGPDSTATIGGGYLGFIYDGTTETRADSKFSFAGNFDVSFEIRTASDPLFFAMQSNDETAFLEYYYDSSFVAGIVTGEETYTCWGTVGNIPDESSFYTEYVCIDGDDIRNKWAPLSFGLQDCTHALNILGGPLQAFGVDYTLQGNRVIWDGYGLDGQISVGDRLRVIYKPRELSDALKVRFVQTDGTFSIFARDSSGWNQLQKRLVDGDGTWSCSFYMDQTTAGESHACQQGRGFVSKFVAISEAFYGTDGDEQYMLTTKRKPSIFYEAS